MEKIYFKNNLYSNWLFKGTNLSLFETKIVFNVTQNIRCHTKEENIVIVKICFAGLTYNILLWLAKNNCCV